SSPANEDRFGGADGVNTKTPHKRSNACGPKQRNPSVLQFRQGFFSCLHNFPADEIGYIIALRHAICKTFSSQFLRHFALDILSPFLYNYVLCAFMRRNR
ncbi:MAG: hypothetical protein WCD37_13360, partial [Chloroflexia bacterium]